ncbi:MAG TPA: response regulator transcription factor [Spirochaetia bacterium]|nr:response regulator transcription factor [Spirochaetia bacterium]
MTARERSNPGYRQLQAQLEQAEALIRRLRDVKKDALGPKGQSALTRLSAVAAHLERANNALRQTVKSVGDGLKPAARGTVKRSSTVRATSGRAAPGRTSTRQAPKRGSSEAERKIRVIIADDHRIFREVLTRVLNLCSDIEVIGEAEDGEVAVTLSTRLKPDVVLMDASLPGLSGVEATRRILTTTSASRIVGLSARDDGDAAMLMVQAGAVAYMTKGGQTSQLLDAIRFAAGRPGRLPAGQKAPDIRVDGAPGAGLSEAAASTTAK